MSKLTDVLKDAGFVGHWSVGTLGDIKRAMRAHGLSFAANELEAAQCEYRIPPGARISVTVLTNEDQTAGKRHPETAHFVFAIDGDEFAVHPASAFLRDKTSSGAIYGRLSQMFNGLVGGTSPQTIVCKDGPAIREVCVFNTDGGAWTDIMEAELQTVLKALQAAGRAA